MRAIPFKVAQNIGDGDNSWIPQWTGISITKALLLRQARSKTASQVFKTLVILALWWLWC